MASKAIQSAESQARCTGNRLATVTMHPDQTSSMPVSQGALTTLDLALIASVALLCLVCGSLALRLHQVQEELESVFLADQAKQKQLEELKQQVSAKGAELETERKERAAGAERLKALEGELAGVKGERDAQAKEKEEAQEEAELTLLQLYQVQEELEHYFLQSRTQDDLLRQHQEQSSEFKSIISKLVNHQS